VTARARARRKLSRYAYLSFLICLPVYHVFISSSRRLFVVSYVIIPVLFMIPPSHDVLYPSNTWCVTLLKTKPLIDLYSSISQNQETEGPREKGQQEGRVLQSDGVWRSGMSRFFGIYSTSSIYRSTPTCLYSHGSFFPFPLNYSPYFEYYSTPHPSF
jgi:hypothetical protein